MATAESLKRFSAKLTKGTFKVFCNKIEAKPEQSTKKSPDRIWPVFNSRDLMLPSDSCSTFSTVASMWQTPDSLAFSLRNFPIKTESK